MNEQRQKTVLTVCGVLFLLGFCSWPFLWMIIVSVSKYPDFPGGTQPFVFTFDNYAAVLTGTSVHVLRYLVNSLVVSAVSAVFATLFAGLSAYAVTRLSFPGKYAIPLLMLAFSMFPQISIVGYLFKLMSRLGWINTYNALIFPYTALGLPLALWIMLSYFSRLPADLDRAALIDGASRLNILCRIILPLALPGAVSTLLLVFIYSFNEFLFALMLTVDYSARTIPVGIALFEGLHGQIPWGTIMAGAVIATAPMIVIAAFCQKYVVQGLTRGAIKG